MKKLIWILSLMLMVAVSCKKDSQPELKKIDFSKTLSNEGQNEGLNKQPIRVAISAMISPKETFEYYQEMLKYFEKKLNATVVLKQRKTYQEINNLLNNGTLDMAFICSGAYIQAKEEFPLELLAVPVVNGKPWYFSYVIVHKDSPIEDFNGLYQQSFAFTDPLSNTGKLYPTYLIRQVNMNPDQYFSKTIYTHAHDYSIHAVSHKIVVGASVDSLIFDFLKKRKPWEVENVKIIKKSSPFGIPPVVIRKDLDAHLKARLKMTLLSMDQSIEGKRLLDFLLIDKFVEIKDDHYDSIRRMGHDLKGKK